MPICDVVSNWRLVNGRNEMAVALDYPASWSDATWQADEYILHGLDKFVARGDVSAAQLTALLADSRYVVLAQSAGEDLTPEQVASLKTQLTAAYHADIADLATIGAAKPAEIVTRMIEVNRRDPWRAGITVNTDDVYYHNGNLYKVIQPHTTQSDWQPNITPALWKRYHEPEEGPQPWVQPAGAHDAYQLGDMVTYGGQTWRSTINANVWQPGVYGWVVV
jgi:hypothetical protein